MPIEWPDAKHALALGAIDILLESGSLKRKRDTETRLGSDGADEERAVLCRAGEMEKGKRHARRRNRGAVSWVIE